MISHLMRRTSPRHLDRPLLSALEGLGHAVAASPELHEEVLRRLVVDLGLWSAATPGVQRSLLDMCLKIARVRLAIERFGQNPARLQTLPDVSSFELTCTRACSVVQC